MSIDAIVPTVGRIQSLSCLLRSLSEQATPPTRVIIADASLDNGVADLVAQFERGGCGYEITHIKVQPPNAVSQRRAAIAVSSAESILLLDDDVVLESECIKEMIATMQADERAVAVVADFSNQTWAGPTRMWRWYLRACGVRSGEWQGRVLGPLLRFGYNPPPTEPRAMEWMGTGNTLLRRSAYDAAGGLSDFFLHGSTVNEDVDLGLKVCRHGQILLAPKARLAHMHAPGGRLPARLVAEDDIYNRYVIMRRTQSRSSLTAFAMISTFVLLESMSNVAGAIRRLSAEGVFDRLRGRVSGLTRIVTSNGALETASR